MNNNFHSTFFDALMPYITMLGEWVTIIPIIIIFAFINYKRALGVAFSGILSFLVVQGLKEFVFDQVARPAGVFANDLSVLHIVENTDLHSSYSFPSGHSAGAFIWCLSLAFYFRKLYITVGLLMLACLTGWSRIYLAQHFPLDVAIGGIIGIASSFLIELWISKTKKFQGESKFMTLFRKK
ncbi:MAG: phosphatase PAP2 family protein [Bacteroidota bacterium]|nr:phosphatase PAP2 family protein [Bacteroidota bacterium]